MVVKKFKPMMIYKEDHEKLFDLTTELRKVQRHNVSMAETLRRTLNMPNLKDTLVSDAEIKRRQKYGLK